MKHDCSPAVRKYMRQVSRKLDLPRDMKNRICSDLRTTINARLENDIPEKQILRDLGTPSQVAAEFNEQMKEFTCGKRPIRFLFLAAVILSVLVLLGKWLLNLYLFYFSDVHSIGIIGGADGPTSIMISTTVSNGFNSDTAFWIIVLLAGIVGYIWSRRKKKKE